MSNEKHVSPIMKTLARHLTVDELNQISGAAFNGSTSVHTPAKPDDGGTQENTYSGGGTTPTGLDTVHGGGFGK